MAKIYPQAFLKNKIIPISEANVSVASSAVLYGLSVYTVFPVMPIGAQVYAFRLQDHFTRLLNSAQIIGMDTFAKEWTFEKFVSSVRELVQANTITEKVFVRASVHVTDLVPGTRSRGLANDLSMFLYEAKAIVPQDGARLKTSVWMRVPDRAIPSRAKVNGAYVNSVLAKQDALDSGYDDCIFLDADGQVCELSAANIFIIRGQSLITPPVYQDILEGINRRTVLELGESLGMRVEERPIDLTELYIADEVFACGTSAFIAPVFEVDRRVIGGGKEGGWTEKIKQAQQKAFENIDSAYLTKL